MEEHSVIRGDWLLLKQLSAELLCNSLIMLLQPSYLPFKDET
jgi:hypothetical protein